MCDRCRLTVVLCGLHHLVPLQVCSKDFFLKTVPLFDGGDDVGMVLSPQCFHNLNLHTDIFNHSNVHFWEYMQPGYDALGFISCTGTNFLVGNSSLQFFLGRHTRLHICQLFWQSLNLTVIMYATAAFQMLMNALPGLESCL